MKVSKRHPNASLGHAAGGKDRALANALLRMSEKTEKQEQRKADDVIYCEEESLHGWTNAMPNPKFSGSKRPKYKKKKLNKKSKKENENNVLMWGMTGMTSSAVDEQNAYATLRDMYDSYKKSKQYDNMTKKQKLVDPETYKYVPWEERVNDDVTADDGRVKLPSLHKLRGAPPSKLLEVLEKYVKKGEAKNPDIDSASIAASDVLDYYDQYRWNFAKEKQKYIKNRKANKRIVEPIHIPYLTSEKKENVEPSVKERLVRYVNGAVRHKKQNKSLHKDGNHAFYIQIHSEGSNPELPSMVRLERKKESQNKNDRWVARVIIKQADETGSDWFRPYKDSESSSSVIIVPDTRWKRKLGVVEGERERIQKEMEKIRFQQQQQIKLNKMKKRLLHENNEAKDKKYRVKRSNPPKRNLPPMFSLVEAAKVSVKYDVATSKRKGVVREPKHEDAPLNYLSRIGIPPLKSIDRPLPDVELKSKNVGEPCVTQIFPSGDESSETKIKEDKIRSGRIFLKRGVATKDKTSQKPTNVRLPVLPKRAKLESTKTERKKEGSDEESKKNDVTDDESDRNGVLHSLPLVSSASATFQAVLTSNVDLEPNTGRTANLDEITQSTETNRLNEKKPAKNTEFIRYKVIPQPGTKTVVGTESNNRKPLHPPHTKNRGQERIQDMIDKEKIVVNSMIDQITHKLGRNMRLEEILGNPPASYKLALNSSIAKSSTIDETKHHQIPASIVDGTRKDGVVMKRRVVPPILTTSSAAPTAETSPTNLPIVSNAPPNSVEDTISNDDATNTSRSKDKPNKRNRARVRKRTKKLTSYRSTNKADRVTVDDIILSGDVIIQQRPTPKLLEHSFAASISSVKPARRIVNISPQRIVQKG